MKKITMKNPIVEMDGDDKNPLEMDKGTFDRTLC